MTYLLLFYEFFKTGLFAIGGGMATLPFIYYISSRYPDWFTVEDISNMIAVSEATPGPLGINMASYAGFNTAGVFGSLAATFGEVLPSLICIIIIAHYMKKFEESRLVKRAFYGLRPAVAGLIAAAAYQILQSSVITLSRFYVTGKILDIVDIKSLIICAAVLVLLNIKKLSKIHPIIYILGGAVLGIFIF